MAAPKKGTSSSAKGGSKSTSNPASTAWQGDSTYQAARNALQSQLTQYGTNLASQANRYDQQYGQDLGRLGLQSSSGARFTQPDASQYQPPVATPNKTGDGFAGKFVAPAASAQIGDASWNQIDPLTSSGRAYTDQANDYAARGMTQSTGYLTDRANLGQSFQNQLSDASNSRTNYLGDLNSQYQAYLGQSSDNLNQARLQAIANYNAQQQTNAVRAAAGIK